MPYKKELRYLPARELRVQTSPDGSRTLSGYAIVYNSPSQDLGGFTEYVAPGAVADSLKNNADILILRDHDSTILLGRTKSNTLKLVDAKDGLRFTCNLPDTTQASDLATSIDCGDLDGVSFGFTTIEDKWTSDEKGKVQRTLLKINLFEISPCSFPAYSASSVSVRSCPLELRGLLRSKSSEDEDEDECDCDCEDCLDGNHDDCEFDCEDRSTASRSNRHKMAMRLALASRNK